MTVASAFDILPAIDLRGGRVVRLEQGDFARETAFADDPVAIAPSGSPRRGRDGCTSSTSMARGPACRPTRRSIAAIIAAVGDRVAVEVAGGLRTERAVADGARRGGRRVVVGTAALRDPDVRRSPRRGPRAERIAVAIDVRDGRAVGTAGPTDAAGRRRRRRPSGASRDAGVTTFEVTAIERDGLLEGPDLALYERLVRLDRGAIIASAGIATLDDIQAVRDIGCAGAILGRALYEGRSRRYRGRRLTRAIAVATGTTRDVAAWRARRSRRPARLAVAMRPSRP